MSEHEFGVGSAHAKAILFGEHAVVYGAPAVAIPVPQLRVSVLARCAPERSNGVRVTDAGAGVPVPDRWSRTGADDPALRELVTNFFVATETRSRAIDLTVDCRIPPGRGLGSSAACARAVVYALGDLFDRPVDARLTFDLVQTAERVAHGSPSGVDTVATGSAVPIWFQGGVAKELVMDLDGVFVIADSGVSSATSVAVSELRRRFDGDPAAKAGFLERSARITAAAVEDLAHARVGAVGHRMTENQALLGEFGLGIAETDRLVTAAVAVGCAGAKLSGGGLGGCVVALADVAHPVEAVETALRVAGAVATWTVPADLSAR
ncbi:mevalonate kinase [Nocardia sp. NBC_00511]|uniref:mevalonate kinase n=1 Tax=Nocardia sp. NBC_00511 TaxID=2903591 RepID=UPI0030DFB975